MKDTMLPIENRRILNEAKNTCMELIEEYKMFDGFKRDAIIFGAQEIIQGIEEIIRLFDVNPEIEAIEIKAIQTLLEDQFKVKYENDIPLSERILLNINDIVSNKGLFDENGCINNYNKSIYIEDLRYTLDSAEEIGLEEFVYWKYKYDDIIKHSELAIKCINATEEGKDVIQVIKDYTGYDEEMNIFHFTEEFKLDWEFDATMDDEHDINKYFITVNINDIRRNAAILINYKNRHVNIDNFSSFYKYHYELLDMVLRTEKNNFDSFDFDKVKYAYLINHGLKQLSSLASNVYHKMDFDASLSYLLAYERVIEHMHSLGYNHKQIDDVHHLYFLYRIYVINNDIDNAKFTVDKVISRSTSYKYNRRTELMNRIIHSWEYLNPEQFVIKRIDGREVYSPIKVRINAISDSLQKELLYLTLNKNQANARKAKKLKEKLHLMYLEEWDNKEIFENQIVKGKYNLAVATLERLLALGYQDRYVYEALIYTYSKMSNYDAVKSILQEAIEVLTNDFECRKAQALKLAQQFNREHIIIEKIEQSKSFSFYECTGIEDYGVCISTPNCKYLDDWRKKLNRLIEKNKISFQCPSRLKR